MLGSPKAAKFKLMCISITSNDRRQEQQECADGENSTATLYHSYSLLVRHRKRSWYSVGQAAQVEGEKLLIFQASNFCFSMSIVGALQINNSTSILYGLGTQCIHDG